MILDINAVVLENYYMSYSDASVAGMSQRKRSKWGQTILHTTLTIVNKAAALRKI